MKWCARYKSLVMWAAKHRCSYINIPAIVSVSVFRLVVVLRCSCRWPLAQSIYLVEISIQATNLKVGRYFSSVVYAQARVCGFVFIFGLILSSYLTKAYWCRPMCWPALPLFEFGWREMWTSDTLHAIGLQYFQSHKLEPWSSCIPLCVFYH